MTEGGGVCISCLETENVFNIFDTHECEGIEEIYVDMLKSCFDITLSRGQTYFMCEKCILTLRHAYYFKQNLIENLKVVKANRNTQIQVKYLKVIQPTTKTFNFVQQLDPETGQMTYIKDTNKRTFVSHQNCEENKKGELVINKNNESLKYNVKKENRKSTTKDEVNVNNIKENSGNDKETVIEATQYECAHCSKKFTSKLKISRHLTSHIDGEFACNICDQVFTKANTRNCHMWRAHQARPYACARCPQRFPTFHQRLAHLRTEHGQTTQYPCPYCDNVYNYAGARSKHIRATHLRVRRHHCAHCSMKFFKRRELLSHMATIHGIGDKNFVCPVCGKSFYRNSVLRHHLKKHTEKPEKKKPYQCTICSEEFKYQAVLRNHIKLHELSQLQSIPADTPQTVEADDNLHNPDVNLHDADGNLQEADGNLHEADENLQEADENLQEADGNLQEADEYLQDADDSLHDVVLHDEIEGDQSNDAMYFEIDVI